MHHDDSRPLLRPLQSHDGSLLQRMFTPLNLAAYVTWLAICIAVLDPAKLRAGDPREFAGVAALIAMLVLFVISASRRSPDGAHS